MRLKLQLHSLRLFATILLIFANDSLLSSPTAAISDLEISRAIRSDLSNEDAVAEHLIDVKVDDGFVTLSGRVDNLLSKDRAENLCYTVRGVRGIVNRIEVVPVKRSRMDIRNDVNSALIQDPVTEFLELRTEVSGDTVTLNGTVESIAEKQLADGVVKGVKGVGYIENKITVIPEQKRSDREIREEVRGVLETDLFVYNKMVKVKVKKGVVMLSGTVGSYAEKIFARLDAYVPGAVAVIDEDLKVELWAKDPLRREAKLVIQPDNKIVGDLNRLFARDPRTAPFDIRPTMDSGVVMLEGTVRTLQAKHQAEETALNLVGVYRVDNRIKVRPSSYPGDRELERYIRENLQRDPIVERHTFKINVRNGKAYIYGSVDNGFEKRHISSIIEKIPGIITVANYAAVRDSDKPWLPVNDAVIRARILEEYQYHWMIDPGDLTVKVKDGVATISGGIESNMELRAIVENAFDAGAKMVVTRLLFRGMKKYGAYDYRGRYQFDSM